MYVHLNVINARATDESRITRKYYKSSTYKKLLKIQTILTKLLFAFLYLKREVLDLTDAIEDLRRVENNKLKNKTKSHLQILFATKSEG